MEIEEEQKYQSILDKLYYYNMYSLDLALFIINCLLIFTNSHLSGGNLVLILIAFALSKHGCDIGMARQYQKSNLFFALSDKMNNVVLIFTVINIIIYTI